MRSYTYTSTLSVSPRRLNRTSPALYPAVVDFPIVVVEPHGPVVVYRTSRDGWQRTQIAQRGLWPVVNPVREQLALSVLDHDGEPASRIELVDIGGNHLRMLHRNPRGAPTLIAARVPHYGAWSPKGDMLACVAPRLEGGLSLSLSEVDGALLSDEVQSGAPLFPTWSPDGRYLAVHAGTTLTVVNAYGSREARVIAEHTPGFRTPAYNSASTRLAYGTPDSGALKVVCTAPDGTEPHDVARFPGGVALAFQPGTDILAVGVTRSPDTGVFNDLYLVDVRAGAAKPERIAAGPFVAYYWAPGGEKLVLVVPAQTGDGRYSVRAIDAGGTLLAATEPILPSQDFRTALGFFDLYGKSHSPWSPDGGSFLLAGRPGGDGVSSGFGDPDGPYVMTWRVRRHEPLEVVGPGEFGICLPRLSEAGWSQ